MSEIPTNSTPSGRGQQLTESQEAALVRITTQHQEDSNASGRPKSFWIRISRLLQEETGRVYSWQSCRRRMLAREEAMHQARNLRQLELSHSDEHGEPIHTPSHTPVFENKPTPAEESDELPETPIILHRSFDVTLPHSHVQQKGKNELHDHVINMIENTMVTFDNQMTCFTDVLRDNGKDCEGVREAFLRLQQEVDRAVFDYKDRAGMRH